ncbi:hypothetical protein F503_05541 [Ophiostoma piceae UAMH 11346]|uniref:Uncharacterized protein n=1 Tax=Ophiostoma piceae (strain UAMH 11346) TaxID=1262450 RepID=S3CEE3_OPHP1|nr:hypothetical protein F503_05541 [Ophiostoma piceae UAMH 11346]
MVRLPVRYSLVAILAFPFAAPAFASPLGADYVTKDAIVISSDIPPERAQCVEGLRCWRGGQAKPKNLSGPRNKRGPPAASKGFKKSGATEPRPPFSPMSDGTWPDSDKGEDVTYYEPESGYANGYEYGYTNKKPDGDNKGCYWGDSDASTQKQFNCPGCRKDFDEVSSHVEEGTEPKCAVCAAVGEGRGSSGSNIAARSERHQTVLGAGIPPNTAAIANGPKFAAVCVVTQLSQMCIAAGNAVCSSTGTLDAKDPRCARACNCVRV